MDTHPDESTGASVVTSVTTQPMSALHVVHVNIRQTAPPHSICYTSLSLPDSTTASIVTALSHRKGRSHSKASWHRHSRHLHLTLCQAMQIYARTIVATATRSTGAALYILVQHQRQVSSGSLQHRSPSAQTLAQRPSSFDVSASDQAAIWPASKSTRPPRSMTIRQNRPSKGWVSTLA